MMLYPVAEKFVSINGEGRKAGELSVFIRFRKCNLNCVYCDTKWANSDETPAEMLSLDEIMKYITETKVKNVTLTGGEPLLQKNIYPLIEKIIKSGGNAEIETNGSISIAELSKKPCRPDFTLDYKLPYSGMEQFMCTENYNYLKESDTVKFVVGSIADLEKACEIIEKYSLLEKCQVYFSPVFDKIRPAEIVDFMKEKSLNKIRLQLQLHKFIWSPEMKGV